MPRFYLRAIAGRRPRLHVRAVCLGRIGEGGKGIRFTVLLSDEWGEKEILRKLKGMGLFELGEAFVPVGPDLEGDLSLLASRAASNGTFGVDEESALTFVKEKLSRIGFREGERARIAGEDSTEKENNEALVRKLCAEGESFLRAHGFCD